MTEQLTLETLHPCPVCQGHGHTTDPETGLARYCRTCEGSGQVPYDPDDDTVGF